MTILLWILGVLFGVVAYLSIGYLIGAIGLKTWYAEDNSSLTSFLLFPVSWYKNSVRGRSLPLDEGGETNAKSYKTLMAFVWPFKFLLNFFPILFFSPTFLVPWIQEKFASLRAKKEKKEEKAAHTRVEVLTPEPSDTPATLFEKKQRLVDRIKADIATLGVVQATLEEKKIEMESLYEAQEPLDPLVAKVQDMEK